MKIHILEPWISGLLENQQSVNPFLFADCMRVSTVLKVGVHSENRETELVPMVGHGWMEEVLPCHMVLSSNSTSLFHKMFIQQRGCSTLGL